MIAISRVTNPGAAMSGDRKATGGGWMHAVPMQVWNES
ncbi:hypothetical protein LG3211_1523 [Lysobacter gummosus]|nr:hypothetical protein LG3211_1523 [Lysobacter gummosus]